MQEAISKYLSIWRFRLTVTGVFFITAISLWAGVTYDARIPQVAFAAGEIDKAIKGSVSNDLDVVIHVAADESTPQAFEIRSSSSGKVEVIGADPVGAMYGGLEVAEKLRIQQPLVTGKHQPHIKQRGIKFNLPLDLRTPTYSDPSDAAQLNIPEMWTMDFWKETFDDMARHRYNVMSLWSLHPFPSIVKVPEFPNVALDDVWRTKEKLDAKFSPRAEDFVRPEMLKNHEVVKTITIGEKIKFWRNVMQYAKDRGVDIYFFTWNVYLYGAEGKDGITDNFTAPRTIEYFRASVRETMKTYPLLAGFGITAGEQMKNNDLNGMSSGEWLWKTYGEGIRDGLKETPDRKFRLIHRFHETGLGQIKEEFKDLPCPLDVSFKYAVAHMYSVPKPAMIESLLPHLNPGLRSWLTIRNDDIYSFRWADVDYARAFIKGIPSEDKIAGFYMGPDGYVWGREFLSKDTPMPRQTVMQKQWLSFALWGRLAYDPETPANTFEKMAAVRFPEADTGKFVSAWGNASMTFPYITRFFWGSIDLQWFPEACRRKSGFYNVRHFIEQISMPGANVLSILDWRRELREKKKHTGTTPLEIAATLDRNASSALADLPALKSAAIKDEASRIEYAATLNDIESMSHLGLYYAAKIRAACDLALYDESGDDAKRQSSLKQIEAALAHWKNYSVSYTTQYIQPVLYNRTGIVNIPEVIEDAEKDVEMVRKWKPGTIDEDNVKPAYSEKGFRK
jgi:hypothetical protein